MAFAEHLNLRMGQRIRVKVEELQEWGSLLVQYQGQLFRVMNTSGRKIQVGEVLDLQVSGQNPIELKFFSRSTNFDRVV